MDAASLGLGLLDSRIHGGKNWFSGSGNVARGSDLLFSAGAHLELSGLFAEELLKGVEGSIEGRSGP